jgi:hypothetical protein
MRERVEHIVNTFESSLNDGSATTESIQQAFVDVGALESITESDRLAHLTGTVRLFDAFLTRLPLEEGATLREQRAAIAALIERKYGPDAPYARSREIVQQVADRLKRGEDSDAVTDAALAQISALPFDDADVDEKATALIAVNALRAATDWLAAYEQSPNKLDPIRFSLKLFATSLDVGGFNKDAALKSASHIRDGRLSFDGSKRGYMAALMISVGLGLRAEPMALPALAQPMVWLAEALNDAQAEANAEAEQPVPASGIAAQCKAIVAQFERDLEAHGFTEYHWRQAMASIQELSPQTPADSSSMLDAVLRVIDMSISHAPPEWAETLRVVRQQIAAKDDATGPEIDLATFETEGQRIVERLRTELASGTPPGAAFAQAQLDLQALAQRLPNEGNDNEAFGKVMLRFGVSLVEAMVPYAESGKETLAADLMETFRNAMADMESGLGDDKAQAEMSGRSALQQIQTLLNQPLGDPFEQTDAPPYHRQFAALVRVIAERQFGVSSNDVLGARDSAEFKRIESRLKVALSRITAATTEAQWIDQQRGSLRAAVLDLRRFERRHHLMVIEPAWTGARPAVNSNAVFVSGGSMVQGLVDAAGHELGYESPITVGVNDPNHARWDLLSRSAIAVFDFTSYDRAAADPAVDIGASSAAMASIAKAAAPTALVAYECGWALALGVAMVIVAREGQAVPFDIDIEPVRLAGDAADVTRVGIALQAALFGTQRGVSAQALPKTIERLKGLTAGDPTAARLIDAADPDDATSVRLAAEGVLDRLEGRGLVLAFPAFPPAYPPDEGRKALFHVTAFRPWSEACQRVVQDACGDAIERRIGYERFDPDIIRAIWNDIATASYVVADLTHLNPNAVLELAIAQAIGRPTLVVSQTPNLHEFFPPVAKVRIHTYSTDAKGLKGLRAAVDRFVAG